MSTRATPQLAIDSRPLTKVALVILFTSLTALAAQARFYLPFTPVPITLQSMMVVLSGAFLGPWLGASSQILLVILGALSFQVFSTENAGLGVIFGPTGGYILGFILCSFLVGLISKHGLLAKPLQAFVFLFLASFALFIPGVIGLKMTFDWSWAEAISKGFTPFLPGDILKTLLALGVWGTTQHWLNSKTS